jgi:hypothetical protein
VLPYAALIYSVLGHNRMSFGGVLAKVILSPVDSLARDVRYLNLHYINYKVDISITLKEQVNREGEDCLLLGRITPSP